VSKGEIEMAKSEGPVTSVEQALDVLERLRNKTTIEGRTDRVKKFGRAKPPGKDNKGLAPDLQSPPVPLPVSDTIRMRFSTVNTSPTTDLQVPLSLFAVPLAAQRNYNCNEFLH